MLALRFDPYLRYCYAYDDMQHHMVMRREIGGESCNRWVTDNDVIRLQIWLQENGMPTLGIEAARSALHQRAEECRFHPVIDYLESLQWDGVQRLGTWLTAYLGAELNHNNAHIGRMFLTSMVARVVQPLRLRGASPRSRASQHASAQAPELQPLGRGRRRRHHVAARERDGRAQLGLPLLLAA